MKILGQRNAVTISTLNKELLLLKILKKTREFVKANCTFFQIGGCLLIVISLCLTFSSCLLCFFSIHFLSFAE